MRRRLKEGKRKKRKKRIENGRRSPARERGRTRVWKSRYLVSGGPRVAAERNLDIGSPGGMKSRWASLGELFVVEGQSHVRSQLGRRKKETKGRKEREDSRAGKRERALRTACRRGRRTSRGRDEVAKEEEKERRKEGRKGRGTLRLVEQRHGTLSTSRKNSIEAASFCRV